MYQRFYHLKEIPFSLAPDPRFLFRTESLLEVLANLRYGIENGKGLVVVTGEVGTGKTTILRSMLQSLDQSVLAAYVFNPVLTTPEFLNLLSGELRLPIQQNKAELLRLMGNLLLTRNRQGLRTVLVIDEAHLLEPHLLEEIRLLSNFETNREKLLQIILCGQPELHELLARPELRQLKQRISLKCAVNPLTKAETAHYLKWRLRLAGAADPNLFQPDAIELVYQYSGGIPRMINNICDNALLSGFSEGSRQITTDIIQEVAEVLDLSPFESRSAITASQSVSASSPAGAKEDRGEIDELPHACAVNESGACVESIGRKQPLDNVRYIRPEVATASHSSSEAPANVAPGAEAHREEPQRFVISPEAEPGADSKFFSRVRVTRSE
ncbi:MAG TPA: AAA family ATPase [Blastocatellia bacterium]|nr:AAA family ATPase [Blastocatellia bacterium]